MIKYIARVNQNQQIQSLETHLIEVSNLAGAFAKKIGLEKSATLIGILHDFGKYSNAFQLYIKQACGINDNPDEDDFIDVKGKKGKIDHSTAGAQYIWEAWSNKGNGKGQLCAQILSQCIASHHSGLIDFIDKEGKTKFLDRINKHFSTTHYTECKTNVNTHLLNQINLLIDVNTNSATIKELFGFINNIRNSELIFGFNVGMLIKYLFSCLIDADRISSAEFESPKRQEERLAYNYDFSVAIDRLETFLSRLPTENAINSIRNQISNNCYNKSQQNQGIFSLTVPTGGGKTYSSLRFALHHAKKHKLSKIFYIIPYTSIIEQNAEAIRNILDRKFEKSWVLEYHSNLEPQKSTWHSKLIAENFDSPIVITTMVQFLETIFSGGTSSIRRLHQFANSVIIFDEIQTIPVKCIHLFCNSLSFLVNYCKTTALLCTATQPLLNKLPNSHFGQLSILQENEIINDVNDLFRRLSRTEIIDKTKLAGYSEDELSQFILEEYKEKQSILVIVNTKEWAQKLFLNISKIISENEVFHLSTNQCPKHRKNILSNIKSRIHNKQKTLCISTQLIEAGVDIDFNCVVRFLSGLDSILQAAGRCNRNGELINKDGHKIKGQVYIVNPKTEQIDRLTEIKTAQDKTKRLISEFGHDLDSNEAIKYYFEVYFNDNAIKSKMNYPVTSKSHGRDDNILNLLSNNNKITISNKEKSYPNIPMLRHSFKEAAELFSVIDAQTKAIVVPYTEDGQRVIAKLCAIAKNFDAYKYYKLIRESQQYSINVFPNVFKKLLENQAICETQVGEGIYYLKEEFYSYNFGMSSNIVELQSFLCI